MLDVLRKYSGVLFFYVAIVGMILLVSYRFTYLEEVNEKNITYAIND